MIIFPLSSPAYTHLSMHMKDTYTGACQQMHIATDKAVHTDKVISGWEFIVLVVCGHVTKKKQPSVSLINLRIYEWEFKTFFPLTLALL